MGGIEGFNWFGCPANQWFTSPSLREVQEWGVWCVLLMHEAVAVGEVWDELLSSRCGDWDDSLKLGVFVEVVSSAS